MIKYEEVREKLLADPEVFKEYELQKAEFEIAWALIKARLKTHMTQVQITERMQIPNLKLHVWKVEVICQV